MSLWSASFFSSNASMIICINLEDALLIIVPSSFLKEIFETPKHPYTKALLSSIPKIDFHNKTEFIPLKGEPTSNEKLILGCKFAPRCQFAMDICKQQSPQTIAKTNSHNVKCFLEN